MKLKHILLLFLFSLFFSNLNFIHAYTIDQGIEDGDVVDLEFEGKLASSGEIFQELTRSELEITASNLIEGFFEGVIGMKVAEDKTIIIPPEKGYTNPETVLYNQTLIFEVHIYKIVTNIRSFQTTETTITNGTNDTELSFNETSSEVFVFWFFTTSVFTLVLSQILYFNYSKPKHQRP